MSEAKWKKYSKEELQLLLQESSSLNDFAKAIGYKNFYVNLRISILKCYPELADLFDEINTHNIKINTELIGYHFNHMTVISYDTRKNGRHYWKCQCDCGNQVSLRQYQIENHLINSCIECAQKNRKIQSQSLLGTKKGKYTVIDIDKFNEELLYCQCDCGNPEPIQILRRSFLKHEHNGCRRCINVRDLTGQTFNKLTVIKRCWDDYDGKNARWYCKCECGSETIVTSSDLINNHILSCGCINSKGELLLKSLFNKMQIDYQTQYTFSDLRDKGLLRFDFAIFKNKKLFCLIEYQGMQHFQSVEYWGGDEYLKNLQHKDSLKQEYCRKKGIPLFYIKSTDFNKINEKFIKELLESYYE